MSTLTTGTNSGIGKYLRQYLGGYGLTRQNSASILRELRKEHTDVIIHCAFNPARGFGSRALYNYLADNLLLTKELALLPHRKFVYFSSVDVYPKDTNLHSEDEIIDVEAVKDIIGLMKLMSESIVKKYCKNYLILRPVAFLGEYSRKNSLIKMLEDDPCILTLSEDSKFSYVLYGDVLDFIKLALEKDLDGIYNISSTGNITLGEIAKILGKEVKFGDFYYDVGNIDNSKVRSLMPVFNRTPIETINRFKGET